MKETKRNIVVYLPQIYSEFVVELRSALEKEAKEKGYSLLVFTCFGDNVNIDEKGTVNPNFDEGERVIFRLPNLKQADGVVFLYDVFAESQWDEIYDLVRNRCQCPVVNFRTPLEVPGVYNIYVDDKNSFAGMVQHFIDVHGARRINLVTGPEGNVHSIFRRDIYKSVLERNRIPYREDRVYYGNFWKNCGDDIVESMLHSPDRLPEVIICANDFMAISVIEALKSRGIQVPEQVLVAGYDDLEESRYSHPALTTVGQPIEQMAQTAIHLLERIWAGEKPEQNIYLPGKVILRQSCGCDPSSEDFSLTYSSRLNERIDRMSFLVRAATTMITFMSGASNWEECMKCLQKYALKETGFKSFALCLAQKWETQLSLPGTDYGSSDSRVTMVAGVHDGKELAKEEFPVSQLLPTALMGEETAYYIIPIHYLQYYMGYAVVLLDYDISCSSSIKVWFLHLDNALENIRIRGRLDRMVDELGDLYVKDTLTGLYNRRGFDQYGEMYYQNCRKNQTQYMLMEIDMDGLKQVNDRYGHGEGDVCIISIANALIYAAKENEICIRSGGDEFVVIGENYSQDKLERFRKRFAEYLRRANDSLNKPYLIGASMGYFMGIPDGKRTPENYLKIADDAMYANKKERKALSHPGTEVR